MDVYKSCPQFENEDFLLRYVSENDCADLLKVYSDERAVPLFNSDNCCGDNFHYTTRERMLEAIKYWFFEYDRKGFVRWAVIDKTSREAVGTIELFHRKSKDYFTKCGLLRLDLRSNYETTDSIKKSFHLFSSQLLNCFTATKLQQKQFPWQRNELPLWKLSGFLTPMKN